MLLFFGLIGLGYIWKFIPIFPNKRIPLANLLTAIVIYPFIAKSDLAETYSMRSPFIGALVRDEIVAICVFTVSWLVHRIILKRWIDKYIPQSTTETGDTKFFRKDEIVPPTPLIPPNTNKPL